MSAFYKKSKLKFCPKFDTLIYAACKLQSLYFYEVNKNFLSTDFQNFFFALPQKKYEKIRTIIILQYQKWIFWI